MIKKLFVALSVGLMGLMGLTTAASAAGPQTSPEGLVRQMSVEVIDTVRTDKAIQAGDISGVVALVDGKVMPHVNFEVMTRSAVGPQWRGASAEQRSKLQAEFKTLLVRVYSGAISQLREHTVEITKTLPISGSTQVVVQSEVRSKGEPIKLDYRMDKAGDAAWKIIDVNVGGLWLVQNYRSQFAQELTKGGVDGLIAALVERNKPGKG